MQIDPKIVEAANADGDVAIIRADGSDGRPYAEARARRVLKAASENVPWEVSLTVAKEFEAIGIIISMTDVAKILSAGLAKWAEEE